MSWERYRNALFGALDKVTKYSDWVCTAVMSNDVMKDLREDRS